MDLDRLDHGSGRTIEVGEDIEIGVEFEVDGWSWGLNWYIIQDESNERRMDKDQFGYFWWIWGNYWNFPVFL